MKIETELQALCHQEQMAAERKAFNEWFEREAMPVDPTQRMVWHLTPRCTTLRHYCWAAWREAKGLRYV